MRGSLWIVGLIFSSVALADVPRAEPVEKDFSPVAKEEDITGDKQPIVILYYILKSSDFNNNIPDILRVSVPNQRPSDVGVDIEGRKYSYAWDFNGDGNWQIIDNHFNKPLIVEAYYINDRVEDWKSLKLNVKGTFLTEKEKLADVFMKNVMDIRGVCGFGSKKRVMKYLYATLLNLSKK